MMNAYRQGLPADGKLFPEGSKVVKIEWGMKKNPRRHTPWKWRTFCKRLRHRKRQQAIPGHAWLAYGNFNYNAASKVFTPQGNDAKCGYACHTSAASRDYIFTDYPLR